MSDLEQLSMEEAKKRAVESDAKTVDATYTHNGAEWPYRYRVTVSAAQKASGAVKSSKDVALRDQFSFVVKAVANCLVDAPFEVSEKYIAERLDPDIFEQIADEIVGRMGLTRAEKKS